MTRLAGLPAYSRTRSVTLIIGLVGVIGWLDYYTGPRLSLELFYLIPISISVAWLSWQAGCVTAVTSIVVRVVGDLAYGPYTYPRIAFWNRCVDLLMYFVVIWVLHALITLQRQLEQRVTERTAELMEAANARRQLEHELLAAGSRERNLFGQELHDDICQHLVGTALAAKVLARHLAGQDRAAATKAQTIVDLLEEGADKTRKLARGLLLSSIDPDKLGEKLSELVSESSRPSLPCRFRQEGDTLVADADIAAQLFRIAQEALRNALRHASPTRVNLSLIGEGADIALIVEDDGRGLLPPDQRGQGMGLRIMAQRATYVGGALSVLANPGGGTRVICRLPRTAASA